MAIVREWASVCCWVEDQKIFNLIRQKFNVVDEVIFDYDESTKLELLRKLYHPHNVHPNDPRATAKSKITVFVLEFVNPKIEIVSRREHIKKPMYADLVAFKEYARTQGTLGVKRMVVLHAPDWLNEANHFFEVFGLTNYINKNKYFELSELSAVIFLENQNGWKNLCIQKLHETPHFNYANGNLTPYEKYAKEIDLARSLEVFDEMIKTIPTEFANLPPITICRDNDGTTLKIYDGVHRASILASIGHLYVKGVEKPENECKNMNCAGNIYVHDHFYDFEKTMQELDAQNIRYVITRGFKKLPRTPDTDIDLVVHPADYDKLHSIFLKRLSLKTTKQIDINGNSCKYVQYKTNRVPRKDIANTYFHIDVYDNCFTFYIKKVLLGETFLTDLFSSRIKTDSYYIPKPKYECFLLLMRMVLECKQVKPKHKLRIQELKQKINKQEVLDLFRFIEDDNIRSYFSSRIADERLLD